MDQKPIFGVARALGNAILCNARRFRRDSRVTMMLANWTTYLRTRGMPLISLAVILSFVFIPVRCDASTAPHSIFVSPNMLNQTSDHQHHAASAARSERSQTIAHHSPLIIEAGSATTASHVHEADLDMSAASQSSDSAHTPGAPMLGNPSDPGSQQPAGATLDLPPSSVISNTTNLQPLDGEPLLLSFDRLLVLSGISTPPDAPPPKSS